MNPNLHIIVGHYGSGKTEFAVSYARKLREDGAQVALADLDIVNPYFRSREHADELEVMGIHVVSSNFDNDWKVDIPALSGEIYSFFENPQRENILDVGGNAAGARVLARFSDRIQQMNYDMWMVVNTNRNETQTVEDTLAFADSIQRMSGLKINGIISNTHMLGETTAEDILRGDRISGEIAERLQIPYKYVICSQEMTEECRGLHLSAPLYPLQIFLRPDYLQ